MYKKWVAPEVLDEMKKGNFNPWAVNIPLIEEQTLKIPVDITQELNYIKNYISKYNCKLLVAYLPPREQITTYYNKFNKKLCIPCSDTINLTTEKYQIHNENLKNNCQSLNIPFLDLTPIMKTKEQKGQHLYCNYNLHLNSKGTKLIGTELYNFFLKNKK
jgi:lysophospholipase L1-like esterase